MCCAKGTYSLEHRRRIELGDCPPSRTLLSATGASLLGQVKAIEKTLPGGGGLGIVPFGGPLYPIDRTPDMIFRALFAFA